MKENLKAKKQKNSLAFGNIREFCKNNKSSIIIATIVLLITYGMKLFNITISHDTEAIISAPKELYNSWIALGRYGLIVWKKLFNTYTFNPYTATVLMFIMMVLNIIIWEYIFYSLYDEKKLFNKASFIFPILFFVSPIMVEQLSFTLQVVEVTFAFLLVGLSILFTWMAIGYNNCLFYLPSIILATLAFATYQSTVPLFVAAVTATFLIYYFKQEFYWSVIFKFIFVFFSSLILYILSNKFVQYITKIPQDKYIEEQVYWGKISVEQGIDNIITHIKEVFWGTGTFYNIAYFVAIMAMIVMIVVVAKGEYINKYLFIIATVVFFITPFLMTILMGNEPNKRSQIVIAFVYAFVLQNFYYFLISCNRRILVIIKYVYAISLLSFGVNQVQTASNMFYMEYVQYSEDVRLAIKISDRIERLGYGESPKLPVVFVGNRQPHLNKSTMQPMELLGYSFYQVSFNTEHASWVMNNFMDTIGFSYEMPTEKECAIADKYKDELEVWPNEGCIQEKAGVIIVKLS